MIKSFKVNSTTNLVFKKLQILHQCLNVRITSYNVCYTKLLRVELGLGQKTPQLLAQKRLHAQVGLGHEVDTVITSYSIHYTKLYEKAILEKEQ